MGFSLKDKRIYQGFGERRENYFTQSALKGSFLSIKTLGGLWGGNNFTSRLNLG